MKRISAIALTAALLTGTVVTAPLALAVASAKVVPNTPAQLREQGFPKKPNTTAWGNGTAKVSPSAANVGEAITITGKAPKGTKPGTILTMQRYLPQDTKGDGTFQDLGITDDVDKNGNYSITAYLGRPGNWGYRVGYMTTGMSPEFIGFQFQVKTNK